MHEKQRERGAVGGGARVENLQGVAYHGDVFLKGGTLWTN